MRKFLTVIFFLLLCTVAQAQTWEVGGGIGGAGYMGDLNQNNIFQMSGLAGNVFVKRNFNGYLSAKGQFTLGKIEAADSESDNLQQQRRNLSFSNKLREIAAIGEFNFMHYIPEAGKNRFTPFVFAGVGFTAHAPRTMYQGREVSLRNLRTEGQDKAYSKYIWSIPYGAGIKYNIGGKWSIIADLGYRYTSTDYLDDVSGVYPFPVKVNTIIGRALSDRSGELTGVNIGEPGSQRGDFRKRDTYLFLNLSLSFTFVTEKCYFER